MTVQITSPVLGLAVGADYTGSLESWLLAEGYAKQAGYTGPGVSNSGAASTVPANDPRLPENRGDVALFPAEDEPEPVAMANSEASLEAKKFPHAAFDFDQGGVDEDATTPAADGDVDNDASTPPPA